jgi:hypothetical protein
MNNLRLAVLKSVAEEINSKFEDAGLEDCKLIGTSLLWSYEVKFLGKTVWSSDEDELLVSEDELENHLRKQIKEGIKFVSDELLQVLVSITQES